MDQPKDHQYQLELPVFCIFRLVVMPVKLKELRSISHIVGQLQVPSKMKFNNSVGESPKTLLLIWNRESLAHSSGGLSTLSI